MSYIYTDQSGAKLEVSFDDVHVEAVIVQAEGPVYVKLEDAPAVALKFLEEAGIDNSSSRHLAAAWRNLNRHESERQAEAEREAEDTEFREWWEFVHGRPPVGISDLDRKFFRKHREFFTREEDDHTGTGEPPRGDGSGPHLYEQPPEVWGEYEISVAYNLSRQGVRNWDLPKPDAPSGPHPMWYADTVRAWVTKHRPTLQERRR